MKLTGRIRVVPLLAAIGAGATALANALLASSPDPTVIAGAVGLAVVAAVHAYEHDDSPDG